MRYLIIGGSGILGNLLARKLADENNVSITYKTKPTQIEGCSNYKIELDNAGEILELIERLRPNIVIHSAAPASVDWHETHKDQAYRINVLTTKAIAEKCRVIGAKLVYVSTTFVFPTSAQLFTEEDIPAPLNFYGATKLGGELATRMDPNHVIVRTDQLYGWSTGIKKSFVETVLNSLAQGQKIEVCEDWYNSPTYVDDLAESLISLISQGKIGCYHVTGNSYVNRVEWATLIASVFDKDPSLIVPIRSSKLELLVERPNVRLSNRKATQELGIKLRGVAEGVESMRQIRINGYA